MPTYAKSEDWVHQSSLLLEARPHTTRITTRYTVRAQKPRDRAPKSTSGLESSTTTSTSQPAKPSSTTTTAPLPPRGDLELKTYDPVSGACLKYRTVKLAEVGRLMQLLGTQLARRQAGIPPAAAAAEDGTQMGDAPGATAADSGVATPPVGQGQAAASATAAAGGGATGGAPGPKGKKKKGKR